MNDESYFRQGLLSIWFRVYLDLGGGGRGFKPPPSSTLHSWLPPRFYWVPLFSPRRCLISLYFSRFRPFRTPTSCSFLSRLPYPSRPLLLCLGGKGQRVSSLPPSVPCIPGSRLFFLGFPLALFRLWNIKKCWSISPLSRTPPAPYSPGLQPLVLSHLTHC